ncbi:MAG TPA: hypothetical protein VL947_05260, partial [Cytophagales bacterium]|nr:hypothetical protein [Cytophagales bacterium]
MIHFSFSRNLRSLFVAAFLIFVALDSLAQYSSIININQVPMLLHPSFVGSTGGRRASAVFGLYDADGRSRDRKYYNLYYDQMWKRIGTGIGGYVNVHYRYVDGARDRRELNRYAQTRDGYVSGGIALAPKYTKLKNEREILYTWSPSISLAYGHNNIRVKTDVPYNNPDGQIPWKGSSLYHHGVFSGTLGGMLNNKVWLVGATLQYESEKQSNTTYTDYTDTAGTYYYYNNGSESYTHRFGGSVIVGLSFPKKEQSLLGISLVAKAT